jgi:hypothetical protein
MDNNDVLKRFDQLDTDRSTVKGIWEDLRRYIMPLKAGEMFNGYRDESSKIWATKEVWDSTAIIGAQRLSAFIHSAMFPASALWYSFGFRSKKLNKEPKAKAWLDDTTDRLFYTLNASNWGLESASALHDAVGLGNACITEELANPLTWEGLEFNSVPLEELCFEEDYRGRVYRFFRKFNWTPSKIISKLGADAQGKSLAPKEILEAQEKQPDAPLEVIFCILPRKGAKPMMLGERVRAPELRPFEFRYVLRKGAVTLQTGGYYEMPSFVLRYDRASGSRWGYGPGTLALPTVKLLNAFEEAVLNAAEKVVDPAVLVTERALLSDLDLGKGGMTTVRSLEDIAPFESKARFDVSQEMLSELRNMVRRFFREDDLVMKDSPAMSATEAQIRFEMLNRVLNGPAKRIQTDLSDNVLQTSFNMMYREKQLEPIPEVILAAQAQMQIEYLGPLMRSQRSDEVAAIERLASGVAAMQKMGFSEVTDVFDAQQLVREMAERLSVPTTMLRSKQEAEQRRKEREQMQAAAQKAEVTKTQAEGARAAAGAAETMQGMMPGGASGATA